MLFNLTSGAGGKWVIEISGAPWEKPISKTFSTRKAAEKWRRDVGQGTEETPVLKPYGAPEPKRARTKKGQYQGDDPSTPDVDEGWVGGKKPKTKGKPKAKAKSKKK